MHFFENFPCIKHIFKVTTEIKTPWVAASDLDS